MGQRAPAIDASHLLQSRRFQWAMSILVGLAVFLLMSWALPGIESAIEASQEEPAAAPTDVATGLAPDSLAPAIPADTVAMSAPVFAAQSLLAEAQVGDRLDIVALLPPTAQLPSRSAVIVRGATVLVRPSSSTGSSIVFAVKPEESIVVAHLVQSGVPLTYALWSESGAPKVVEPLDPAEVRARLGLGRDTPSPTVAPSPTPGPAGPTPVPEPPAPVSGQAG